MNRAFIFVFLLLSFTRYGYGQSVTPEFELLLHYSDPGGGGSTNPVGFGYDPAAKIVTEDSTEVDTEFGEMIAPFSTPGGLGNFEELFLLDPIDGADIDILPKPDTNSFVLQYTFYLTPFQAPATLSWDRSKIPSAIKGIWITPLGAPFLKMADMTQQDSVVIDATSPTDTNYYINWNPAIFTIYYNTPPYVLDVAPIPTASTGLLSGVGTYPNPMGERGTLSFSLSMPATVNISGYDAIGRQVLNMTKNVTAGNNTIDLSALSNAKGAVLLRINASTATMQDTKTVMMVKE